MKKVLSFLMTVAMIISTASAVFAADYTYTLEPSVTEAKPGDVIEFKLTLPSSPGIAYYKNVLTFDGATFDHEQYYSEDDYDYVDAYSKLGSVTYNETEAGRALMVMSRASDNKNPWMLTVCYKVADDAVNGDYTFSMAAEQVLQASGTQLSIDPGVVTVKVTGGKEPASSFTEAEITEVKDDNKDEVAPGANYTQGFMTTIKGNSEKITAVDFVLTASNGVTLDSKNNEENITGWSGLEISGDVTASFAINVVNIPDTESVSIEWVYTK